MDAARSALRALWQAGWLERRSGEMGAARGVQLLAQSCAALELRFPEVERQAEAAGWRLSDPYLVPDGCVKMLPDRREARNDFSRN